MESSLDSLRFGEAAIATCDDLHRVLDQLTQDLAKNFHVICLLLNDPRSDVVDDFLKKADGLLQKFLDHALADEHDMVCFGRLLEAVPALRNALPESSRPSVDHIMEVRGRAFAGPPRP